MSAPAPVSMPMTTPVTAKVTNTTQPQPTLAPQHQSRNPQHRSRPSHDDELIEETFKDSDGQPSRCRWSPYWYVTTHAVSRAGFELTHGISGVLSHSNSSAAVAGLRLPVVSFAAAPSFNRQAFSVDCCNLGPEKSGISPQRWRTDSPHLGSGFQRKASASRSHPVSCLPLSRLVTGSINHGRKLRL